MESNQKKMDATILVVNDLECKKKGWGTYKRCMEIHKTCILLEKT